MKTDDLSRACHDVLAERQRQIETLGYDATNDADYTTFELARAAACYCLSAAFGAANMFPVPVAWPWAPRWWKPKDRRTDLVRAAALILAEIDRLDAADDIPW